MAESSTTSSLTSTSHTLTIAPTMNGRVHNKEGGGGGAGGGHHHHASGGATTLPSLSDISAALAFREALQEPKRHAFLQPAAALPTAASQFAQVALSALAGPVSDEQQERLRQQQAAKRRKPHTITTTTTEEEGGEGNGDGNGGGGPRIPVGPLLKIRRVHVDGFEVPQIWQQAQRILAATLHQAKHTLEAMDQEDVQSEGEDVGESDSESGVEVGEDEDEDAELEDEDEDDYGEEEEDEEDEDVEDDYEEEEDDDGDEEQDIQPKTLVEDANGLNDGFFDIDEFNRQAQYFEDQDARADPHTDAADEDEELDWHADPFAEPVKKATKGKKGKKGEKEKKSTKKSKDQLYSDDENDNADDDDDDDDDGPPIFGDMDLDAPSGASDDGHDDDDDDVEGGLARGLEMDMDASDIFYKDFFAPPADRRGPRSDRDRPGRPRAVDTAAAMEAEKQRKQQQQQEAAYQPDETEIRRGMASVRRDLFEQVSEGEEDDEEDEDDDDSDGHVGKLSDVEDAGDPRARRSTHDRRQAKILAEIRRLEAEAVRAKDWTMAGEAAAAARPLNSLLEEDLDFEHMGKPVPVATQELNEDMEAMVKRRILEQTFDEVRRRYAVNEGGDSTMDRRGLVDIDDQQAKQGLAAVYEEAHQKHQSSADTPYVSAADARQAAEEAEVARLWTEVSAQLDALSSWHYRPRPAAAQLTVVADVATVAMEDAQPATAQGIGAERRMLAPQEVYKPGGKTAASSGEKGEEGIVVPKSGLPVARDELTREERKRRRRRNKERIRKSGSGMGVNGAAGGGGGGGAAGGAAAGAKTGKADDTMATLRKAGVKVIGRKGEIRDLDGGVPQAAQAVSSGHYKL